MALTETAICNLALAKIGALRLTDLDTDTSVQAIQCQLHYDQTRDALLRSHWWRFASARAELVADADDPTFEWDNQFVLPDDFLRLKSVYDDNNTTRKNTLNSFALEGSLLLTNDSTASIRYIKKVTDVTEFDPLFVEVLVLNLAIKLVMPLAQDRKAKEDLIKELRLLMPAVRTLDRQETNTIGRSDLGTWNDARLGDSRINSKLGSA